jgi:hypothetical protein
MAKLAFAVAVVAAAGGAALAAVERGGDSGSQCRSHGPARAAKLDLAANKGREALFLKRFDRGAMYYSLAPDSIRSIDRPCFERPNEANGLVQENDLVIGLEHGGESRAYPVDLLSLHEIVNDVVGGKPVAITWCPLCASAVGYERRVGGRALQFGVSGFLYRSNLMLFDRQTGSLWSQLLGGAVTGSLRGTQLTEVPLSMATWKSWRDEHPHTKVLSIRRDELAENFTDPHSTPTARGVDESNDPYGTYVSKVPVYFPNSHRGVPDASLVLGLARNGHFKAYVLLPLQRRRVLNDELAGDPVLLTYDEDALAASAYSRRAEGRTLTFQLRRGRLVDRETGSRWSPTSGRALDGALAGKRLERLSSVPSYWFAWRRFHPATAVWGASG